MPANHRATLDAGIDFWYMSDVSGPARVSAGRSVAVTVIRSNYEKNNKSLNLLDCAMRVSFD